MHPSKLSFIFAGRREPYAGVVVKILRQSLNDDRIGVSTCSWLVNIMIAGPVFVTEQLNAGGEKVPAAYLPPSPQVKYLRLGAIFSASSFPAWTPCRSRAAKSSPLTGREGTG